MKYIGIADCHGVESFITLKGHKRDIFYFLMRAQANRQRHAVFYAVDINQKVVDKVNNKIKTGDFVAALKVLKAADKNPVFINQYNAKRSWKLIPNPRLDPYG